MRSASPHPASRRARSTSLSPRLTRASYMRNSLLRATHLEAQGSLPRGGTTLSKRLPARAVTCIRTAYLGTSGSSWMLLSRRPRSRAKHWERCVELQHALLWHELTLTLTLGGPSSHLNSRAQTPLLTPTLPPTPARPLTRWSCTTAGTRRPRRRRTYTRICSCCSQNASK